MDTKINLSQIGLYNPQRQSNELTEKLFVIRQKQFNSLMESLNEEAADSIPQHHLILAQRGMGKTTLLKRIEVELHKEAYRQKFIPVLFPEEQYSLSNLPKFWLNCLDALADSLDVEKYDKNEINKIDLHIKELMHSEQNDDINEKVYRYLMLTCNSLGRRPVLLVDNIGLVFNRLSVQEQHVLRGYISEKACPIIISAGVTMAGYSDTKEHVVDYKAPFYDFFQTHYLKKMNMEEFMELIQNLSKVTQINISITSNELPRLQTLLQLTGGNPRTSVMLFKLLVKGFSDEIVDDLEALLDEITPLYKARFEELPTQQQIILDAIAQNWNPMSLKKISEETRFANNQLSPQLKRLVEEGWLETTKAENAKGNAYSITERFFCIYHIMRNGSRRSKKQIAYLSKFLESFYGKMYLSRAANSFISQDFSDERKRVLAIALVEANIEKADKKSLKEKLFHSIKELKEKDAAFFEKNRDIVDIYKDTVYEKLSESFCEYNYNKAKDTINEFDGICSETEMLKIQEMTALQFKKFDEAEKVLKKAIRLNPGDAEKRKTLGSVFFEQHKYLEAEEELRSSIALNDKDAVTWANLGHTLIAQGKTNEAENAFRQSVRLNNKNVDSWENLIKSLSMQEKYEEAEIVVRNLTGSHKNNTTVWNNAGDFFSEIEKFDDAEKAYEHVLKRDKNDVRALLGLLQLHIKSNRYENAEEIVRKIQQVDNLDSNIWELTGDFYVLIRKYEEAEKSYVKAISLDENNSELWLSLGKLYERLKRHGEAEEALQKVVKLDKNNSNAWHAIGNFYSAIEKYEEAEKAYKRAIKLKGENLQARIDLSKLYIKLHHHDKADKEIRNIEKLDTGHKYVDTIGKLYLDIKRYAEAEKCLQQAVKSDDANGMSWVNLGRALLYQEKYEDAELAFKHAVEIKKQNPHYWGLLGASLLNQGKNTEAEEALRQAILLDKDNAAFLILLGVSLSNQGKYKEAVEVLKNYIDLNPANANAFRALGDIYVDIKEYKKAIAYYSEAIQLKPNDERIFKERGDVYSRLKDSIKAIADYTKAIDIDPNYSFAYSNRGWEYTYGGCKDYSKAVADYTKAVDLDANSNAKKLLIRLYRDIEKQLDKAYEVFNSLDIEKTPKDVYYLEQTIFELHKRNEGIAGDYLQEALMEIEEGLNPKTQSNWEYFAAIAIKLGYAQWLLGILSQKGFDVILSPFFVAIQALETEKIKNTEAAEIYLKNQAVEKSEPARIIIEKMRIYL